MITENIAEQAINANESEKRSLSTMFHALESYESFDTFMLLSKLQPSYIILYDCDMTFVRQVEAFQAARPSIEVR